MERLRWRIESEMLWTQDASDLFRAGPIRGTAAERTAHERGRKAAIALHKTLFPEGD